MSLTRAQWEEMWASICRIEQNALSTKTTNFIRAQRIMTEVRLIKSMIQEVIGQME